MTNLEHFLIAYEHIKVLTLPECGDLLSHVRILKTSADVIYQKLCPVFLDIAHSADKPTPSVSLGAKREGRRN